jgi:hypothetical protein
MRYSRRVSNVSFKGVTNHKKAPFKTLSPIKPVIDSEKLKREEIRNILDMLSQAKISYRDLGMPLPDGLKGSRSSVLSDAVNLFK